MSANGPSQPILPQLDQAHRTQFMAQLLLLRLLPIKFYFWHVGLDMANVFRLAHGCIEELSSLPFVYKVAQSCRQGQEETANNNKDKFGHEAPEVQKLYGDS